MKKTSICLKGLMRMMRPSRPQVLLSIAIGWVRIAASLAFVWISKCLVDIATGLTDMPLWLGIVLMIGIIAIQIVGNITASYCENFNMMNTRNKLQYQFFSHTLNSRWNGKESFLSGDMVNRLMEDIRVVSDIISSRFPDTIVTLCQLAAASIYLMSMAPQLLWMLLTLMVLCVVGSKLFFTALRKLTQIIRERDSQVQQHLQESLQNRLLVLTLMGSKRVLEKLNWLQEDLKGQTVKRLNLHAIATSMMGLGFRGGYVCAFLWGIFGIRNGAVSFGMMTAFLQLVGQIQRPIADLSKHIPAFIHSLTSLERLLELEDLPEEENQNPEWLDHAPDIELKDVSFRYGGNPLVIKQLSHTFRSNTLTAIMGPTGAGKSTLTRLILGLLIPEEGEITLDGKPMKPALRNNFMYVPQGNSLLSGTIRENLLWARHDATEDEMRQALHCAVADFVYDLPDGLDTLCGEVGSGLSEGQAQRIAIARALLHRGHILLLDESTSSVDSETEKMMLERLLANCRNEKTILFVTHRQAVADMADEVLKLKPSAVL